MFSSTSSNPDASAQPAGADPFRRLACDRCHKQKLRCSRDETGCARCGKAGTRCVYSTQMPGGRPRGSTISRQVGAAAVAATPSDALYDSPPRPPPPPTVNMSDSRMVYPAFGQEQDQDQDMMDDLGSTLMARQPDSGDKANKVSESDWLRPTSVGINAPAPRSTRVRGGLEGGSVNNQFDNSIALESTQSAPFDSKCHFGGQTVSLQTIEGGRSERRVETNDLSGGFMDIVNGNSATALNSWDIDNSSTSLFDTLGKPRGSNVASDTNGSPLTPFSDNFPTSDATTEFIDTLLGLHRKFHLQPDPVPSHIHWSSLLCADNFDPYLPTPACSESLSSSSLNSASTQSARPSVEVLEIDKVFEAANTLHDALKRLATYPLYWSPASNLPPTPNLDPYTPRGLDGATLFLLISSYLRIADTFKSQVVELNRRLEPHYTSKDLMEMITLPTMQIGSFTPPGSSTMRIALVLQLTTHLLDRIDKEASQIIETNRQDQLGGRRASDDAIDSALRVMRSSSATVQKEAKSVKRKLEQSSSM